MRPSRHGLGRVAVVGLLTAKVMLEFLSHLRSPQTTADKQSSSAPLPPLRAAWLRIYPQCYYC